MCYSLLQQYKQGGTMSVIWAMLLLIMFLSTTRIFCTPLFLLKSASITDQCTPSLPPSLCKARHVDHPSPPHTPTHVCIMHTHHPLAPTCRSLLKSASIAAATCGPNALLLLLFTQGLVTLLLTRGPPCGCLWGPGPDRGDCSTHSTAPDNLVSKCVKNVAHLGTTLPVIVRPGA